VWGFEEEILGIRDLFSKGSKEEIIGTKVLLASLDPKFTESMKADCRSYSQFYAAPVEMVLADARDLLRVIAQGYDIVHLFCDVSPNGNITDGRGNEVGGGGLLDGCCEANVKLLWLASENKPEGYIKGFRAVSGKPLNLVLTIDRRGAHFSSFLENLVRRMSAGETMPVAWVSLSPQNSNDPRNQDAPACIFSAGRGRVRLR
jgi:hypothetical protein